MRASRPPHGVELPVCLRNTCTLVPTLNFACWPMARKDTVILSWPRIRTPTCRFRERKVGLSGTWGPGDVTLCGHVHRLTLLPARSKCCPPCTLVLTLEERGTKALTRRLQDPCPWLPRGTGLSTAGRGPAPPDTAECSCSCAGPPGQGPRAAVFVSYVVNATIQNTLFDLRNCKCAVESRAALSSVTVPHGSVRVVAGTSAAGAEHRLYFTVTRLVFLYYANKLVFLSHYDDGQVPRWIAALG